MRKILAITLTLVLLLTLIPSALAESHPFHDVLPDAWYADAVQFVYKENIMGGVGDGRFHPQGNVSRAEVTALLFRTYHGRSANATDPQENPFTDVGNAWYAPYVTWAHAQGIVNGTTAETFHPQGYVTRQEFAVMIHRYAVFMTAMCFSTGRWITFPSSEADSWARDSLLWAGTYGIMGSYPDPRNIANRAEAATIMMRLVEAIRATPVFAHGIEFIVSVEDTNVPQGYPLRIRAELTNHSGNDYMITFHGGSIFRSISPTPLVRGELTVVSTRPFAAGSTIQMEVPVYSSSLQVLGVHKIRLAARFSVHSEDDVFGHISMASDPLIITVQ